MKEILLYGLIDSQTSADFINSINEISGEDISVRLNCGGGEPEYGWGMAAKYAEIKETKNLKVDGCAYSMGLFFVCYSDYAECLDVSEFLVHRAAYSQWFENSPEYFTKSVKENLVRINESLKKALESKIDVAAFENLKQVKDKGIKFKDIFSLDSRIDVFLSAKDAKKIGLIDKINPLTRTKKAEIEAIESRAFVATAKHSGIKKLSEITEEDPKKLNDTIMTIEKLKAEHPEVYAQIFAAGIAKEKDRCGAWAAFMAIDPEGVTKGIKDGSELSATAMAEFTLKAVSKQSLKNIEDDSTKDVTTGTAAEKEKTEKEAKLAAFEKAAKEALKKQTV